MLVEHHMDFVMSVCDRVAVLDFGRVICIGPPETVRWIRACSRRTSASDATTGHAGPDA